MKNLTVADVYNMLKVFEDKDLKLYWLKSLVLHKTITKKVHNRVLSIILNDYKIKKVLPKKILMSTL